MEEAQTRDVPSFSTTTVIVKLIIIRNCRAATAKMEGCSSSSASLLHVLVYLVYTDCPPLPHRPFG